ncbi:hypothetical protein VB713_03355 [Anabaena cylindrica UHCC 0172]|uniref:hypothetical protein n=1 Tax=Anabaena cylindrica TaxID=1165 RepID=UPI002B213CF1|nr:hypothetical protein [Anabaena cylindrica]MEA5550025.1 hypothetical protein [Anabaena cylindrica UHCC 0172]
MPMHFNSNSEYLHLNTNESQDHYFSENIARIQVILPELISLVKWLIFSIEDLHSENQQLRDEREWLLQEVNREHPDCLSKADSLEYEESAERLRSH